MIDPRDYGALPSPADSAAAFQAAADAARGPLTSLALDGRVLIPPGTWRWESTVTLDGCDLIGEGPGSYVTVAELGDGVPALRVIKTYGSPRRHPKLADFVLEGPGDYALGQWVTRTDGIRVEGAAKPHLSDLGVSKFGRGIVAAGHGGHLYVTALLGTHCTYGIFIDANCGDFKIRDCDLTGCNVAGIGVSAGYGARDKAWNQGGMSGATIEETHLGFAPYGIYQEAGESVLGTPPFLIGVTLDGTWFESIGNAAMFSELDGVSPGQIGNTGTLEVRRVAFGWNPTYRLPDRPRAYSVVLPRISGAIEFHATNGPFGKGDLGTIRIHNAGSPSDHAVVTLTGPNWIDDGTLVSCGVAPGPPVSIAPNRAAQGYVRHRLERACHVGTDDAVSFAAGSFTGWLVKIDSPAVWKDITLDVLSNAGANVRPMVFDASKGLTNCPLVWKRTSPVLPTPGLATIATTGPGVPLKPGIYAIGVAVQGPGVVMAGANGRNLAQIEGAVSAGGDVFTSPPATVSLARATSAPNVRVG